MEILSNEELRTIKYVVRFGKNGRKYVWQNIDNNKILRLAQKYGIEELNNDYLWLSC